MMHERPQGLSDGRAHTPGALAEAHQGTGLYLYCVADSPERVALGRIGLGGTAVYTIPWQDICAVVHRCLAEPHDSREQGVIEGWALAHQRAVEAAWRRWGTVLPSAFDTVFRGRDEGDVGQKVRDWLAAEYPSLKAKIGKVRGKAEYGVQVSWSPEVIGRRLVQSKGELAAMKAEIASKPDGTAYLYREKLKVLLRREMEGEAARCFQDLYRRVREHVDDLRVERTRKSEAGHQMILNVSCLASQEQSSSLGRELSLVSRTEGFLVRFTGPWPPYSFVGET